MTDQKTETVIEQRSDYSVVNRYAELTLDRHRSMLANEEVVRTRRVLIAIAVLMVAIGLAIFLYFNGLAILERAKKEPVKEVPQVLNEIQKNIPKESLSENNKSVKTEFTVFFTHNDEGFNIVTGWNFTPEDTEAPYSQYCYHAKANTGQSELTTYVARKNGVSPTIWETNVTPKLRQLAKKHCNFK